MPGQAEGVLIIEGFEIGSRELSLHDSRRVVDWVCKGRTEVRFKPVPVGDCLFGSLNRLCSTQDQRRHRIVLLCLKVGD
jgi:hypothetical protein